MFFIFVSTLFCGYYYGNTFPADSQYPTQLNGYPTPKISFRFTAVSSIPVTTLSFYIQSFSGSPTYTVGISSDNNGIPGSVLSSAAFVPTTDGFVSVSIPQVSLVVGNTYHFVIEPTANVNSSNYMTVCTHWSPFETRLPVDLSTNTAQNFLKYTGSGWTVFNQTPVYVITHLDGTSFGNPYYGSAYAKSHGNSTPLNPADDYIAAQVFTLLTSTIDVTRLAYRMYKSGTPGSDPWYYITDITGGNVVISSGVLSSESSVPTSPAWVEKVFLQPVTLKQNRTYRVELRCTTGDSSNFYTFACVFTSTSSPYVNLTYNGTTSYYLSSTNGGATWTSFTNYDNPFRFFVSSPPAKITDLQALPGLNEGEVKLSWTATGDDGYSGTAAQYFVRYASYPIITNIDWLYATNYTGLLPAPLPSGTTQSAVLTGLPKGMWYFAIRAKDNDDPPLNISPVSNSPRTNVREIEPFGITTLVGTPLSNGTSVQLNWLAPGDDYTTGTAESYDIRYSTWVYSDTVYKYYTTTYFWLDDGLVNATIVANGDKVFTNVSLPFPFKFYGVTYTTMDICSDGYISFTYPGVQNSPPWDNTSIPYFGGNYPDGFIAGLWDDLNPSASGSGKIYYKQDCDKVIITYNGVYRWNTAEPQYFQIILYKDNTIVINYKSLTAGATVSSTVGVENQNGTVGVQYNYNGIGEILQSSMTLVFYNGFEYHTATVWNSDRAVSGQAGTPETEDVGSLQPDTTYYFAIKTADDRNNYSCMSNIVSTKTVDIIPPGQTVNLSATQGTNEGEIQLTWNMVGDNGYTKPLDPGSQVKIQYSTWTGVLWSTTNAQVSISTHSVTVGQYVSFTITGLTNGVTYYFRLWTGDEVPLWSAISNGATTWAQRDYVPPAQVILSGQQDLQVKLTWTSPGDNGNSGDIVNGKYQINYTSDPAKGPDTAEYSLIWSTTTSPKQTQTVILTSLTPRVTWYFWLRTGDEVPNWSAWSNQVSVVPWGFISLFTSTETLTAEDLLWGDFDNDGDLDIVCNNYGSKIMVYQNNNGSFVNIWSSEENNNAKCIAAGDYNNDGLLDFVVGNISQVNRLYRNNGDGTFTYVWYTDETDNTKSISFGDYDNDGDLDIAVGNDNNQPNRVYKNNGDGTFSLVWTSWENESTTGIMFANIDNDYDLDIIVCNWAGPVRVYENYGYDWFYSVWSSTETGYTTSLAVGDYDNNGYLDIAITNSGIDVPQVNRIYRNNGDKTFSSVWISSEQEYSNNLSFGDYNNDGNLDIIVCSSGTMPRIRLYQQVGGNNFLSVWSWDTGNNVKSIAFADIDNDGDTDFLAGQENSSILVFKSVEADKGNVNTPPTIGGTGSNFSGGILYLQCTNPDDGQTPWSGLYYNIRVTTDTLAISSTVVSGVYGSPMMGNFIRPYISTSLPSHIAEFRFTNIIENVTYYYWFQTIDTGLRASSWTAVSSICPNQPPAQIADLTATSAGQIELRWTNTGDDGNTGNIQNGKFEIQYSTSDNFSVYNSLVVSTSCPAGSVQYYTLTGLIPEVTYYIKVRLADEVPNWSSWSTVVSTVSGWFVLYQEPAGTYGPGDGSVAWGDFDNDGDLDLAVNGYYWDPGSPGQSYYKFQVYRNDNGNFVLHQEPAGTNGPSNGSVAWGDFDNDGDLDLAVNGYYWDPSAGQSYYKFQVYRNDNGNFVLHQEPAGASGPSDGSVSWGDFDNDGDLDLAVNGVDSSGYRFRVYRNDNGNFVLHQEPAGTNGPSNGSVAWGDFDNDGDLDLAVNGYYYDPGIGQSYYKFQVYRNDNGNFILHREPAGTNGPSNGSVAWGDFDNDGDLDLAVNGYYYDPGIGQSYYKFQVYRNDNGNFILHQEPAGTNGPSNGSVAWGDFDNDGDLDLAVNGYYWDPGIGQSYYKFQVYRNNNGNFVLHQEPTGTNGPSYGSVAWGDFDNDGDLDLAVNGNDGYGYRFKIYKSLKSDYGIVNSTPLPPTTNNFTYSPYPEKKLTFLFSNGTDTESTDPDALYYVVSVTTVSYTLTPSSFVVSNVYGTPLMGNYLRPRTTEAITTPNRIILSGLQEDTTYYFRVATIDSGLLRSTWSVEFSTFVPDTIPPGKVTGVTAYIGEVAGSVFLEWTSPGDNFYEGSVTGGKWWIKYSSTVGSNPDTAEFSLILSTDYTQGKVYSYLVTGLIPQTLYRFWIKARDNSSDGINDWSLVWSDTVSIKTSPFNLEVVDTNLGLVGGHTSIVVDNSLNPHISYRDATEGRLKYAKWTGTVWEIQKLDNYGNNSGLHTSIKLNIDNNPYISFYNAAYSVLRFEHYDGIQWTTTTVDSPNLGQWTSLDIDMFQKPHISYYDITNGNLKYATYDNGWVKTVVDDIGDIGEYTSVSLDAKKQVHISYYDVTNKDLKYAHYDNVQWSTYTVDSSGDVGKWSSITVEPSGRVHISYIDAGSFSLKYASGNPTMDSSWSTTTILSGGVEQRTSIALDGYGNPYILCYRGDNTVLAYLTPTGWKIQPVDTKGDVGRWNSIFIDSTGTIHIAYYDYTNQRVKYGKWQNGCPLGSVKSSPPTGLHAYQVNATSITWQWNDNSYSETGYRVVSITSVPYVPISGVVPANVTSTTTYNLTPNTSYSVFIECFNDGTVSFSSPTLKWTLAQVPTGTYLTDVTSYSAKVSWFANNPTNPPWTKYEVQYSTDYNFGIYSSSTTQQLNTLIPLNDDTIYYFRVRAKNEENVWTGFDIAVATKTLDLTPPGKVTGFTATTGVQVLLQWTAPGDNVYSKDVGGGMWEIRFSSTQGSTPETAEFSITKSSSWLQGAVYSEVITGLKPRTTYYFWIRTRDENTNNWSIWSDTATAVSGSFVDTNAGLTGVSYCSLSWGDYDNDDDLDLAIAGYSSSGRISKIYRNDNGAFTDINATLTGVNNCSLSWGDYDNDGDLDLAIAGNSASGYISKIYRNDNGNFADINATLTGVNNCSLSWGDYDNDGDLDLAIAGWTGSGRISKVYRNDNGNFTDINAGLPGLEYCSLVWGDYDNDGDLDLAIAGWTGSGRISKIYRNDNGNFTDINAGLPGLEYCSLVWGDYDNDGDLDLAIAGDSASGYISKIYRNDNGNFADINTGLTGVYACSLSWGDYDNDGDLDLAIAGNSASGRISKIYRNDNGNFVDINTGLTGVYACSLSWGDYDNDGDLDLAIAGHTGSVRISKIYKSLESEFGVVNSTPSPPPEQAFSSNYNEGVLTLTWQGGDYDVETSSNGLYYNVAVTTDNPENPQVFVIPYKYGSPLMGDYLRPKISSTTYGIKLTSGIIENLTYYWAVQTIDTGLRPSTWSVVQSTCPNQPPGKVTTLIAVTGNIEGEIDLSWLSSGDDNYKGNITNGKYKLKYSTYPEVNWEEETGWDDYTNKYKLQWSTDTTPAELQKRTITGLLSGVTYYFRLWLADEVPNWSVVSVGATSCAQHDVTPPAGITDLTGIGSNDPGKINLTWTATGDDGQYGNVNNGKWYIKYTTDVNKTYDTAEGLVELTTSYQQKTLQTYTIEGLQYNRPYYIWIKAADERLNISSLSNKTTIYSSANIPLFVTPWYSEVSTYSIKVNWLSNGNPEYTKYYCEISSLTPFSPFGSSGWTTNLNHTFVNLSPNCSYYCRVKAKNEDNVETSTAVTTSWKYTLPTSPNLFYTGVFISSTNFSANVNILICSFTFTTEAADKFKFYWGTNAVAVPDTDWGTPPESSTGVVATSADGGFVQYFRVGTVNPDGDFNNIIASFTIICDATPPKVNLESVAVGVSSVTITFSEQVINALTTSYYKVYYSTWYTTDPPTDPEAFFANVIGTQPAGGNSYTLILDKEMVSGTTYTIKVSTEVQDTFYNYLHVDFDTTTVVYTSVPNSPPTGYFVITPQQSTDGDGKVTLQVKVNDPDKNPCELKILYSTDTKQTWFKCTITTVSATYNDVDGPPSIVNDTNTINYQIGTEDNRKIITASGENTLYIVWSSSYNIPSGEYEIVYLSATVKDNKNSTYTFLSSSFSVDNKGPTSPSPPVFVSVSSNTIVVSSTTADDLSGLWKWSVIMSSDIFVSTNVVVSEIFTTVSSATSTGLFPNVTYYYKLQYVDTKGNKGEYSDFVSTHTKCAIPGVVVFPEVSASSITISWSSNNNSASTEYELWYSSGQGSEFDLLYSTFGLSYVHTGLTPNVTYYYKVRAKNLDDVYTEFTSQVATHTLCNTPTNLQFSEVNITSVTITWSANGNSTSTAYEIFASTGTDSSYSLLTTVYSQVFTHTGLTPNVTYYYKVRAKNLDDVVTDFTSPIATHTLCNIPTNLQFSEVNITSVTITWSANGNSDSTAYEVFASTGTDSSYSLLATVYSQVFTHTGLTPNVTCYYKIRAKNLDNIVTEFTSQVATHTLCNIPTNLQFSEVNITSVTITWSDNGNSGSTIYEIFASTGTDTDYLLLATVSSQSFTHTGLSPNVTYYYKVRAKNLDDVYTEFTLQVATHTLCNTPTNLQFSEVNITSVTITWSANGNSASTGYEIFASTGTDTDYSLLATVYSQSFTHTGLSPNVTYYYKVRAKNLDNVYTEFTSQVATHTLCNIPTDLQFSEVNITSVTITWAANGNSASTGYEIFASTGTDTGYSLLATTYSLSFIHIGLAPNVTYYYKVRAKNLDNVYTSFVEESTHTLCVIPQDVRFVNVYLSSATVIWSSGSVTTGFNPEYTTYIVEVKPQGGTYTTKYTGPLAEVTVTGLAYNTTYYVRVKAQNIDNVSTEPSVENSSCTLANIPYPQPFSSVTNTSITSRWLNNDNPDGTIYICEISSVSNFTTVLSSQTTSLQSTIDGLYPNTTYYSQVKAKNFNNIDTEYVYLGSTITLCSPPGVLPIQDVYLSSITVVWSSGTPANPEYTTYELHYSSLTDFDVYYSTVVQSISYVITGLSVNTTYYFRVRAINLLGIKTEFVSLPSTPTLCNIPANLEFSGVNISSISIQWNENSNPSTTKYEIWCSTGTDTEFGKVRTVVGNNFVHFGLVPNTTYYYKVCAVNHSGRQTEFTQTISTYTLCNPPTAAYFINITASSITVNWSSNGNSIGTVYFVEISSISTPFTAFSDSGWTSILSSTFGSLSPLTTYYFRAKAKNYAGVETQWVSFGSTRTLCNTPGPVQIVDVTTYSITYVIDENNNPPSTLYSVKCILYNGTTMYVQSNGTLAGSPVYRTKSDWEVSGSTIVDINILPNRNYILSSNARPQDSTSTTPYSTPSSTYTLANIPTELTAVEVASTTIKVSWQTNNNSPQTEYKCELSSVSDSGPFTQISNWITATEYTFSGLVSNTTYYIRAKARNYYGYETEYTSVISTATAAVPVKSISVVTISTYSITWQWEPYGNERDFFAEVYTTTNTPYTKLKDTGWTNSTWWYVDELLPNTSYQISVKTRNMFNVETETRTLVSATQIEYPTSVAIWYVGSSSISFSIQGMFTNFNQGESGIYVSTTSDSGPNAGNTNSSDKDPDYSVFNQWVNILNFTDVNLVENATYGYRIKLRNIDGVETGWWDVEITTYTTFATPTQQHFWIDYNVSRSTYNVIKSSVPQFNAYFGLTGVMVENVTMGKVYVTTNTYEVVDTDLQENTSYTYRIKYKNVSGIWSDYSPEITKYTLCREPYDFNVSPTEDEVLRKKRLFMTVGRFNNDNVGNSGYRFVCISGEGGNNSPWNNSDYGGYEFQTVALLVNSSYTYQALYRNADGIVTYGPQVTKFTYANIPSTPVVLSPSTDSVTIKISTDDGNPSHTEYAIYNETEGKWVTSSGTLSSTAVWLTYTGWGGENGVVNTGLRPNTTYYYKIKARNGDGVETDFSSSSEGISTLATVPLFITKSSSTKNSITWSWESGGGEKEFYAWMEEPSTSTGWTTQKQWVVSELLPNTSYQVFLKARNNVNIETVVISTIAFTSVDDIPPGKITSFVAYTGKKVGEVELQWVAAGNDGYSGDVIGGKFEIFVSTTESFDIYQSVIISTSYYQGSLHSIILSSLVPKTTYYFKIRSADEFNNLSVFSDISSCVSKYAPSVVWYKPQNGEVGVLIDTNIELIFDTEIDTKSVKSSICIIAVKDNFSHAISSMVSFSLVSQDKIKFVIIPEELNKNYTYKIVVSTGISDIYGNYLQQKLVFEFTTIMDRNKDNRCILEDEKTIIEIPTGSLPEDAYIIASTEPLTSPVVVDRLKIVLANEKIEQQYKGEKQVLENTVREFVLFNKDKKIISGQFKGMIKISIPYKDADQDGFVDGTRIKEKTLKMYYLDEDNNLWVRIPTSVVDKSNNIVYAYVSHFSVYTIIGEEDFSLDDTYAYPVPFRPNFDPTHKVITFTNLSRECVIKIYTLNGELIKTIYEPQDDGVEDYKTTWDGKEAGSDVYIYVIENKKNRKTGKLIIIK